MPHKLATYTSVDHALRVANLAPIGATIDYVHAWEILRHVFPEDREAYDSPDRMADALIGQNYKLSKAIDGIDASVFGLSLAPHNVAGCGNLCSRSTPDCRSACLFGTGHNVTAYNEAIKILRTVALYAHPEAFVSLLIRGIERFEATAKRAGMAPFFRLNVLSDIPWEAFAPEVFARFPGVTFYDYTKIPDRSVLPDNYSLTFSYSGANERDAKRALDSGRNVAVVFDRLPETYWGYPVVNGDLSDLRPLDPSPVVVGLRYKRPRGVPMSSVGPFVVRTGSLAVVG